MMVMKEEERTLKLTFSSFFTSIHPIRGRGEIGTFEIAIFVHVCFVFAQKSTAHKPNRKMPSELTKYFANSEGFKKAGVELRGLG